MGVFQKQFDKIVEKAVLHYANKFEKDHKDIVVLLRLKRRAGSVDTDEPKKKYDLCIKLLVDMRPVQQEGRDWELRFLEDILLRSFFDPMETLFIRHIKRTMIELAAKGNISTDEIKMLISLTIKKYLESNGKPIYTTSVAMYNGGKYVKTISEDDIMSDEQIMETTQNMQNGADND